MKYEKHPVNNRLCFLMISFFTLFLGSQFTFANNSDSTYDEIKKIFKQGSTLKFGSFSPGIRKGFCVDQENKTENSFLINNIIPHFSILKSIDSAGYRTDTQEDLMEGLFYYQANSQYPDTISTFKTQVNGDKLIMYYVRPRSCISSIRNSHACGSWGSSTAIRRVEIRKDESTGDFVVSNTFLQGGFLDPHREGISYPAISVSNPNLSKEVVAQIEKVAKTKPAYEICKYSSTVLFEAPEIFRE
jgi:hypothetical protein